MTNIYRWGQGTKNRSVRYADFDCDYHLLNPNILENGTTNPGNRKYYQGLTAFFNFSSIMGAPVFVSKTHMLGTEESWHQAVQVFDESGQHPQRASHFDESFVTIEPVSGVSFQATINLQANLLFQPDELFSTAPLAMYPVYSIYRCGNLTPSVVA